MIDAGHESYGVKRRIFERELSCILDDKIHSRPGIDVDASAVAARLSVETNKIVTAASDVEQPSGDVLQCDAAPDVLVRRDPRNVVEPRLRHNHLERKYDLVEPVGCCSRIKSAFAGHDARLSEP